MKQFKKIFLIALSTLLMAAFNPQSKRITEKFFPDKNDLPNITPALLKNKGFTNYHELIAFLEDVCEKFPNHTSLSYIGKTKNGLDIPMIILSSPNKKGDLRVWMQGGLHGNEPASTESMLYLIMDVLSKSETQSLLEKLSIAIVPMANIDGYLKQNRNNAEDLDLNRDQTKLMATESPLLKKAFTQFDPHIALDFHEYRPYRRDFLKLGEFGVTGAFDVMLLYSGNLNVSKKLRQKNNALFLEPLRKVLDSNNLTHFDYVTSVKRFGEIYFKRGAVNARSSASNFALQNVFSTLIEVRGVGLERTSFKRRIFTGYLIALTYLKIAAEKSEDILEALNKENIIEGDVVIKSKSKVYTDVLKFIDVDKTEYTNIEVTFQDALQSQAVLKRPKPNGYFIAASQQSLIEKLQALGIIIQVLEKDSLVNVECYTIDSYKKAVEKYEKLFPQEVKTTLKTTQILFEKGAFFIDMQQNKSGILVEILEPEAPSSFVSLGVLITEEKAVLPIYRYFIQNNTK